MIRVGIVGSTGYGGCELVRFLLTHKEVEIKWVSSRTYTDQEYSFIYASYFKLLDQKCVDENIEDYFALPTEFLPNNETFILKIHGESMINVGFYENDYIIVERTSAVSNGDIVVALIDDSATVKRFYKEDGHIRLQPENDNMDPIIVPDCEILGRVHSLYRPHVV